MRVSGPVLGTSDPIGLAEFYERLEKAGFLLDFGDDESGLLMKSLRRGSGYYIDVGAADLVAGPGSRPWWQPIFEGDYEDGGIPPGRQWCPAHRPL